MEDWTQAEIAAEVGISQQRVSQIIMAGAGDLHELPREAEMRSRRAQVNAKISYWSNIVADEALPLDERIKADKRLGYWWDFRARLNAEYAPSSVWIGGEGTDKPAVTVVIEGDDIRKALS
jgi:transcriptional regulator with XRE-family HTH domain